MVTLPRLYAIADVETLRGRGVGLREFGVALRAAAVRMVQLRNKSGDEAAVLEEASVLRDVFEGSGCVLIMNDHVRLVTQAGFDGVHVGQGDSAVEEARRLIDQARNGDHEGHRVATELAQRLTRTLVGVSTHTEAQVRAAEQSGADYVAIGPVFATGTKKDAAAVVGLAGVRRARALTRKPLVAIGGITRENCGSVVDAGADAVAVISGLLVEGETVERVARDFLELLR